MEIQEFIPFISNVGFPIFIAMFLLIKIENKIDQLIGTFMDLTDAIHSLIDKREGQ